MATIIELPESFGQARVLVDDGYTPECFQTDALTALDFAFDTDKQAFVVTEVETFPPALAPQENNHQRVLNPFTYEAYDFWIWVDDDAVTRVWAQAQI